MELPHMGQHCSEQLCKQLDYLPMKCDACSQLFCKDHLLYDDHNCTSKYKKDIQVPVCPLCSAPVPTPRGTLPDIAVGAHIDRDCQSKPREKVFTNRCNKARCKKKELMPLVCSSCRLNFCLAHRHPQDHACQGPQSINQKRLEHFGGSSSASSKTTSASSSTNKTTALSSSSSSRGAQQQPKITSFFRGGISSPSPTAATATINGMSEDEALAAAIAASMQESSGGQSAAASTGSSQQAHRSLTQEEEDRQLALALQESLRSSQQQPQQQQQQSCSVS